MRSALTDVEHVTDILNRRSGASPKEGIMKRISKFTVVAFLFAAGATAMPPVALAQTGITAVASTALKGESTDGEHKDWVVTTIVTALSEVVL